jgi:hypothetical protein
MNSDVLIILVFAIIFFGGGFYLAYKVRKEPQDKAGNDSSSETKEDSYFEKGDEPASRSSANPEVVNPQDAQPAEKRGRTSSNRKHRKSKGH